MSKDRGKLVQERCQLVLNELLKEEDNKYCCDCDAKGPRWSSWNLGLFLCIRCAGIHRNLGVHISKVKSVNLDSWSPEMVVSMQQMGNSRARSIYEHSLPTSFRRPQTDVALESFIRAKYEHKKYILPGFQGHKIEGKVDWEKELDEMMMKKKKVQETVPQLFPKLVIPKVEEKEKKKEEKEVSLFDLDLNLSGGADKTNIEDLSSLSLNPPQSLRSYGVYVVTKAQNEYPK